MNNDPFHSKEYDHQPGDTAYHKGTLERVVILFHLPLDEDDVDAGFSDKYHVRRPCGRRTAYYGVELSKEEIKK